MRLINPSDNANPVAHFLASVNDLIEHALRDVDDSGMVGMIIHYQLIQKNEPIVISFTDSTVIRRRNMERVSKSFPVGF